MKKWFENKVKFLGENATGMMVGCLCVMTAVIVATAVKEIVVGK